MVSQEVKKSRKSYKAALGWLLAKKRTKGISSIIARRVSTLGFY